MKKSAAVFRCAGAVFAAAYHMPMALAGNEPTAAALPGGNGSYVLQLVSGLAIVLLSIVVLAWLLKKLNRLPHKGAEVIEIIATLSVGPRERVVVVRSGGLKLLLGVAPGNVSKLHVLTDTDPADADMTSFATTMAHSNAAASAVADGRTAGDPA